MAFRQKEYKDGTAIFLLFLIASARKFLHGYIKEQSTSHLKDRKIKNPLSIPEVWRKEKGLR
jgi:hypothetical protein